MSKRNRRIEKTIKELRGTAERLRRLDWDILAQTLGVDEAHDIRNEAKNTSVLLGVVANTLDLMHIPEDLSKQLKTAPLEKVEIHSADGGSPVIDSILLHEKYGDSEEFLGSLESGIRREITEDLDRQVAEAVDGIVEKLESDRSVEPNVRRDRMEVIEQQLLDSDLGAAYILDESGESVESSESSESNSRREGPKTCGFCGWPVTINSRNKLLVHAWSGVQACRFFDANNKEAWIDPEAPYYSGDPALFRSKHTTKEQ